MPWFSHWLFAQAASVVEPYTPILRVMWEGCIAVLLVWILKTVLEIRESYREDHQYIHGHPKDRRHGLGPRVDALEGAVFYNERAHPGRDD